MSDNQKKLPLPIGSSKYKSKKRLCILVLLTGLLLVCAAILLLANSSGTVESTRVILGGNVIKVTLPLNGRVEYVVRSGQPVSAGETILRMDSVKYEAEAKEAEAVINSAAELISMQARRLMLQYLSITQNESELIEALGQAKNLEKSLKNAYDEEVTRQAVFAFELRKLELKQNKLLEEERRMEAMRVMEPLAKESLKKSYAEYETASLERSGLEKLLDKKRSLYRSLMSLPSAERKQLYELEKEFLRLSEAEKNIELSSVISTKPGKVIYSALTSGEFANRGDIAVYLLPAGEGPWFVAYFNPTTASQIKKNTRCKRVFDAATPLEIEGLIMDELPPNQDTQDKAFKVVVDAASLSNLRGINLNADTRVIIGN